MIVHSGFESWTQNGPTVASVGNYDGVHIGHKMLLSRLVGEGRRFGVPSVVVTFDPVPRKILRPEAALPLIQTLDQRLRCIEDMNVDHAVVVAFSRSFARKTPEEFVRECLVGRLAIRKLVVGESFVFGFQRKGNLGLLRQMGKTCSFEAEGFTAVKLDGVRISSTLIRHQIRDGNVEEANRLLGHPFALVGSVVEGEKLGGRLGIPTANLAVENEMLPAHGVYVTRACVGASAFYSVSNVGIRPTLGGARLTVEAHLLDFSADLYGRRIQLEFLARLRDERKFASVHDLREQILSDISQARSFFAHKTS